MKNIFKQDYKISRKDREFLHKHNSSLIWFTGLSGSGKSTLANLLEQELHVLKISTFVLDGDNIRHSLNKDLTFSLKDRSENIRRIGEVAKIMLYAGVLTIAAFVSPYKKDREMVKNIVGSENFIEIYVNTSLAECEKRIGNTKSQVNKMIKEANDQSEKNIIKSNEVFHKLVEIRKKNTEEKIKQLKNQAIKDIKNAAVQIAFESIEKLLLNSRDKSKLDKIYSQSLEETKLALQKKSS